VGEFYKKGKYDTPEKHHILVSNEESTYALGYIYDIENVNESGISESFNAVISFPNQAQGMVIAKDKHGKECVVISTSYSIPSSKIKIYESPFESGNKKTISVDGREVALYELNSSNLIDSINAPAMSEEMAVKDGRVFILFESACKKYKMFNRTRTKNVFSIQI